MQNSDIKHVLGDRLHMGCKEKSVILSFAYSSSNIVCIHSDAEKEHEGEPAADSSSAAPHPDSKYNVNQVSELLCEMLLCLIKSVNQEDADAGQMSSAVVQECSGSVCVRGAVHCRAYIHTNKPKTRHAAQVSTIMCVTFSVLYFICIYIFSRVKVSS